MINRLLFSLLAVLPFSLLGQKDASLPALTSKISLLNDRLSLLCPAQAIISPRPHNVLSPPPSPEQETRITCQLGTGRMVIFVQEMNSFSTHHLLENVKSLYTSEEKPDYLFRSIITTGRLPAILTTPLKRDSTAEAILINSLLVQTKDSTLVQVAAFIDPKAYSQLKQFLALSEVMMESIAAGTRQVPHAARKETVPVLGGLASLILDFPKDYILLPEKGFDYTTYQIRKLEPITHHVPGGIIVYTGLDPKLLAPTYHFSLESGKIKNGLFLGKKQSWKVYGDPAKNIYLQEVIYDADECGKGMKIHIAVIANSEAEMNLLIQIAGKISLNKL
jgi:hypothetical protein